MIKEKLDRINELARLQKERALTAAEKDEQAALRAEYIEEWRAGAIQVRTVLYNRNGSPP